MNTNPLKDALRCVRDSKDQEFLLTFCRVSGYLDLAAQRDPGVLCEVGDVQEIFDRLYKMRFKKENDTGIKDQTKTVFEELEKVMNINYNQEAVVLSAIEKGLREGGES